MSNTLTDRRRETRVDLCVPLKFRALTLSPSGEQAAESINLSQRGMCVSTSYPLAIGTHARSFPDHAEGIDGQGRVGGPLHGARGSRARATLSSKTEVGLRVERYEPAAQVRERWAS